MRRGSTPRLLIAGAAVAAVAPFACAQIVGIDDWAEGAAGSGVGSSGAAGPGSGAASERGELGRGGQRRLVRGERWGGAARTGAGGAGGIGATVATGAGASGGFGEGGGTSAGWLGRRRPRRRLARRVGRRADRGRTANDAPVEDAPFEDAPIDALPDAAADAFFEDAQAGDAGCKPGPIDKNKYLLACNQSAPRAIAVTAQHVIGATSGDGCHSPHADRRRADRSDRQGRGRAVRARDRRSVALLEEGKWRSAPLGPLRKWHDDDPEQSRRGLRGRRRRQVLVLAAREVGGGPAPSHGSLGLGETKVLASTFAEAISTSHPSLLFWAAGYKGYVYRADKPDANPSVVAMPAGEPVRCRGSIRPPLHYYATRLPRRRRDDRRRRSSTGPTRC